MGNGFILEKVLSGKGTLEIDPVKMMQTSKVLHTINELVTISGAREAKLEIQDQPQGIYAKITPTGQIDQLAIERKDSNIHIKPGSIQLVYKDMKIEIMYEATRITIL